MAGATGPAIVPGGPPGPKKPGLMAWAKKNKGMAAAAVAGLGLGGFVLFKRNQANAGADTGTASDQTAATTQGTGTPANFDGGGSDDSQAFQQLSDQLSGLGQQLTSITAGQNPPPATGTNFYQLARSVLQKNGNKTPSKKEIDRERRRLLQVLGPAKAKGKLISEKLPPVHKPTPTRNRK